MIGKYVILECGDLEGFNFKNCQCHGPFGNVKELKAWIRKDAAEHWNPDGVEVGAYENWGSRMLICRITESVKAVPVVSVKFECRRAK